VDQAQVELLVRVTARISAAAFAAALIALSLRRRNPFRASHEIRFFIAFILAHTIHFGTVMWLAVMTAGQNIRIRGGWIVVLPVAALFYLAAFAILRAWISLAARRVLPRGDWWAAHVGVVLIALIFLNSYIARVGRMPAYWVPAILMIAAVVAYFTHVHVTGSLNRDGDHVKGAGLSFPPCPPD
jgi:hypothetical protein